MTTEEESIEKTLQIYNVEELEIFDVCDEKKEAIKELREFFTVKYERIRVLIEEFKELKEELGEKIDLLYILEEKNE